jgi:hypothetical protein
MIETQNFKEIALSLITPHLRSKGEEDIDIKGSYIDELGHNTLDYKGSELGVFVNEKTIKWGNDSNPMSWDVLYNKFIESTIPIHDNTRTGYWGAGVSKIFVYKHGLLDYQCSIESGKYLYRLFTYDGIGDVLTFESLYSAKDTLKITVQEYEVSEDDYRNFTQSDEFDNLPTFFISVRRWDDCNLGMNHRPDRIIDSLNSSFMNVKNFKAWIKFGGKKYNTRQVYYPTTITDEMGRKIVPHHYSQLIRIGKDVELIPGVFFDVYFFIKVTQDKDGIDWLEIQNQVGENNIYKTKHYRYQNPRHIWIDYHDITLVNEDVHTDINNEGAYYGNLIFKIKRGQTQYNTIKTSGVHDELRAAAIAFHKEWLKSNTKYQYNTKKGEDKKVDELVNYLICDENTSYQSTLIRSIRFLSNKELDEDDLITENSYEVRQKQHAREYDLIISNRNGEKIIHFEFMNNSEDNKHIDGCLTRSIANVAKYNVLIVDNFRQNTNKLEYAKVVLGNTKLENNVWAATYSDLLNGNVKGFIKLN